MPQASAANSRECPSSTIAIARMRRACLASVVRAAAARNCAMLQIFAYDLDCRHAALRRINDSRHRLMSTAVWESPGVRFLGGWYDSDLVPSVRNVAVTFQKITIGPNSEGSSASVEGNSLAQGLVAYHAPNLASCARAA